MKELIERAIEFISTHGSDWTTVVSDRKKEIITELQQLLEQMEKVEPVGWITEATFNGNNTYSKTIGFEKHTEGYPDYVRFTPLYTHPKLTERLNEEVIIEAIRTSSLVYPDGMIDFMAFYDDKPTEDLIKLVNIIMEKNNVAL